MWFDELFFQNIKKKNLTVFKHRIASWLVWHPWRAILDVSTKETAAKTKIFRDPPMTLSQIFSKAEEFKTPAHSVWKSQKKSHST